MTRNQNRNRKENAVSEFKSYLKTVQGNEGGKCRYNTRLDTFGCGCQHDCSYCYAKSLLDFRGLWSTVPRVADIHKIRRTIQRMEPGSIVRMGGMSDCFQPMELRERVTLQTIRALNERRVRYLIVTKSHLVAEKEYLEAMDPQLAHIQITVTSLDDKQAMGYEMASPSSMRITAYWALRERGFDVAMRFSPLIDGYMDFDILQKLDISKCVVEFLRVNTWIRRWFADVDYSGYTLRQSGYHHLQLDEKLRILERITVPEITVCEDVTEHYLYWREHVNPNPDDCCNLRDNGVLPG